VVAASGAGWVEGFLLPRAMLSCDAKKRTFVLVHYNFPRVDIVDDFTSFTYKDNSKQAASDRIDINLLIVISSSRY
jgi:hypothetical protein